MAFSTYKDIADLVCQHLGVPRIATLSENSKAANEISACLAFMRQDELREHTWRFAIRRAPLRVITATTKYLTFPTYAAGTTYQQGDIVVDSTVDAGNGITGSTFTQLYLSLQAANVGHTPSSVANNIWWAPYFGPTVAEAHDLTHTYSAGELVWITTATHLCKANGEINHTPPNTGAWTVAALTGVTNTTLFIPYPLTQFNAGTTRYAYQLPFGYLRPAPQDAKIAGGSTQLTSAGMQFSNYQFEGNYLLTDVASSNTVATLGPLMFRFVADITDVSQMDPMFCRAFAAYVAFHLCETITGNIALKQTCAAIYDREIAKARLANLLEQGQTDPMEEDYPLARIPMQARPQGSGVQGHTVNIGG